MSTGDERRMWRKGSQFGDGLRVPLDRNGKAVMLARLDLPKFRGPGKLTPNSILVGRRLVLMVGPDGRLDPSVKTIGRQLGIAVSTVRTALKRLKQFGFLTWTRRIVRVGGRVVQTSNAYAFCCETVNHPGGVRESFIPMAKKVGGALEQALRSLGRALGGGADEEAGQKAAGRAAQEADTS